MNPGPEVDRVLLAHLRDCLDRILEYRAQALREIFGPAHPARATATF